MSTPKIRSRIFWNEDADNMVSQYSNDESREMVRKYILPPLRPNSFRHTMATHLFSNRNMDVVTISAKLDHAKPSMTMNIYAHRTSPVFCLFS